eukprot:SAG31_NODE_11977_length_980_cov_1.322361_2_plen_62_part_00
MNCIEWNVNYDIHQWCRCRVSSGFKYFLHNVKGWDGLVDAIIDMRGMDPIPNNKPSMTVTT